MKKLRLIALGLVTIGLLCSASSIVAAEQPVKIGVVNFKTCVEQSKMGKQEQSAFEALKKQMESSLEEKEKTLNELATKLNDPDHLDSLSPESETELRKKFRVLSQELSTLQNQFFQALQQTNFKVVQKLEAAVTKAATAYAKEKNIDLVTNEEGNFYYNPSLDISKPIIALMDKEFEKEAQEANKARPGETR